MKRLINSTRRTLASKACNTASNANPAHLIVALAGATPQLAFR